MKDLSETQSQTTYLSTQDLSSNFSILPHLLPQRPTFAVSREVEERVEPSLQLKHLGSFSSSNHNNQATKSFIIV
jgi:hypothetical protein